jgi:hypothetical protein
MKINALEESTDFAILDTEKLFSKLKSHELSRKGHPNHDASFSSKDLITSARVGGHDANPTTTILSALEFALSSLAATSDEQYESISDDEITLLVRKFRALHKFHNERRRSPRAALSVATPLTSSPTAPRGRSSTPRISTTTSSKTTIARATTKRSTTSGTTTTRSSRRSCPKRVLPSVTLTSPVTTPPAQRRMRSPSLRKMTSPAFASWASL